VWTLSPDLSFKSTGGHASTGFGIRDSNILGSGQYVDVHFKHDQERNSYGIGFKNPNINGSRLRFEGELATNSDGHHYYLQTGLPFYALDDPRSWQASYESTSEILNQYAFGERVSALQHDELGVELVYGRSTGVRNGRVSRYSGGLHVEEHEFVPVIGRSTPDGYRAALNLDYPFVQYELIDDNYVTGFNIGQIARTEDLHIGRQLRSRVGYAPGGEGYLLLNGEYADMLFYSEKVLLQLYGSWDGRWNRMSGHWEDTRLHAGLEYHLAQGNNRVLFLGLEANKALNLQDGTQLVLGGSNGLRGYDSHFLNGEGSVQFTAEERYYTNYHLFQLARVGFAAFVDTGRVFGNPNPLTDRTYADFGFGLRLAPSKSESGQVIHVDVAWPLQSTLTGERGPQFMVEVRKTF
jgi:Omp85 superfamily domain